MELTQSQKDFIREHATDDPGRLLLSASRYPDIDIPFIVDQIVARRQIKDKLPGWHANQDLIFPAKIAAEQCSSEYTAEYKQRLIAATDRLCDLTGGLGIDTYFFSRKAQEVFYIERFSDYCEAAQYNFRILRANNVTVINGDASQQLTGLPEIDVFYIDPARRGTGDKRVYALSDCEPDLPRLLPELLGKAPKVIAKLSPMADIRQTLDLLPGTTEIHVLSVKNECKELLFVIDRSQKVNSPRIICANLINTDEENLFSFILEEERMAESVLATGICRYLYEPNASLLKAGAFKSLSERFKIKKLAVSSHLYTSDQKLIDFPGRLFEVEEIYPFRGKLLKSLSSLVPQANITSRNFPLSPDELRGRTKIKDGGDVYLFATTQVNGEKVLIRCKKEI